MHGGGKQTLTGAHLHSHSVRSFQVDDEVVVIPGSRTVITKVPGIENQLFCERYRQKQGLHAIPG